MSRRVNTRNPKRLRILSLVRRTPSISHQELAEILGMSIADIHHHLVQLEKEGVINRSRPSGGYYKSTRHAIKKTSKQVSSEKLTEYARLGRGKNAFVPRKTRKRDILQERIDRVVKKAMEHEGSTQHDVVRHVNAPLRIRDAHKVG